LTEDGVVDTAAVTNSSAAPRSLSSSATSNDGVAVFLLPRT